MRLPVACQTALAIAAPTPAAPQRTQQRIAVLRLDENLDAAERFQERPQAVQHERLVVRERNSHRVKHAPPAARRAAKGRPATGPR
jgi:hypothetical protein